MAHSTLGVDDFQYLHAFRRLLPARLLRLAVRHTSPVHRRDRLLPCWLVLGGLVAWFFFAAAKLPFIVSWLCQRPALLPSDSAIYQTRRRLGWAPLRWLKQRLLKPLAVLHLDPGCFYRSLRLLAVDGTTFTVADTPDNERAFGRSGNQHGRSGFPLLRVVALCEVGTHALLGWVARRYRASEPVLAKRLYRHIPASCLLLGDRNFHGYALWQAAAQGQWQLLLRIQAGPKLPVLEVYPDGSYRSRILPRRGQAKKRRAIAVRVLCYGWTDAKGKQHRARLLSSLLSAAQYPAQELLEVYHHRWQQEGVFREIKAVLAERTTQLRSLKPLIVLQELDGLLLGHYVLRDVILRAARRQGVAAVAISFTATLRIVQTRLGGVPKGPSRRRQWWQEFLAAIGREKVQQRRPRCCPRKKKVTRQVWPTKKKGDGENPIPSFQILRPPDP